MAAELLLERAFELGSSDNLSAVLVLLDGN